MRTTTTTTTATGTEPRGGISSRGTGSTGCRTARATYTHTPRTAAATVTAIATNKTARSDNRARATAAATTDKAGIRIPTIATRARNTIRAPRTAVTRNCGTSGSAIGESWRRHQGKKNRHPRQPRRQSDRQAHYGGGGEQCPPDVVPAGGERRDTIQPGGTGPARVSVALCD